MGEDSTFYTEIDLGLPIAAVMLDVVRMITFGDDFNLSI
jgi:hypothetical protein